MSLPAQFSSLEAAGALPARPLHLAIGMFDGAHLGHRAVIAAAVQAARQSGGAAAVLTFWPHPSALFRPENPTRMIQDGAMKARVLLTLGVDAVITESFTPAVAGVAAEDFLPWLQQRLPYLACVYVGENFRFGRGRMGDVDLHFILRQHRHRLRCHHFALRILRIGHFAQLDRAFVFLVEADEVLGNLGRLTH